MNKNINLEEALEQNNYADVSVYISESINQLKTFLYKQEITALEDEIEKKKAGYSFLVKKELVKKNVHFLFGRYIGFVAGKATSNAKIMNCNVTFTSTSTTDNRF